MDPHSQLDYLYRQIPCSRPTIPTLLAYAIAAVFFVHQVLVYLDFAILSPLEILWNALVYITPTRFLLGTEKRKELRNEGGSSSATHAVKSEAMRAMLGLGGRTLMQQLPASGGSLVRKMSMATGKVQSDAPPGLGNWDNSCYQNSVLQGLSAVSALRPYLDAFCGDKALPESSTSASLQETVRKLNDASNNGRHIWTPAKLKSMSSWQQQDAQEYYSKIVDDLEKEAEKVFAASRAKAGLERVDEKIETAEIKSVAPVLINPLEGLLAQRVACTRCGYTEGLSMIPFNCLTVPLGSGYEYDLSQCLDEYTSLEDITEVECAKCTLLKAERELKRMLPKPSANENEPPTPEIKRVVQLPPELRAQIAERLRAIEDALDRDDFSDATLNGACQISKKARVSSTKTRQAVVGRAPQSLVIHVQRSVFDEMTGDQRKNTAAVRYPSVLNLGSWTVDYQSRERSDKDHEKPLRDPVQDASTSMLANRTGAQEYQYQLKAVIQHYGRHENGHYIAYRQHAPVGLAEPDLPDGEDAGVPVGTTDGKSGSDLPWWRLSDEDVSSVQEEVVLGQGGVFMLFYERIAAPSTPEEVHGEVAAEAATTAQTLAEPVAASPIYESAVNEDTESTELPQPDDDIAVATSVPLPNDAPDVDEEPSTGTHTEDESEATDAEEPLQAVQPVPKLSAQPRMRTARMGSVTSESGFGPPHRFVAAT